MGLTGAVSMELPAVFRATALGAASILRQCLMPFPVPFYICASYLSRYRGENVYEETRLIIALGFEKQFFL